MRNGFTLIEIVVVLGIIGMLSGIALGYNRLASSEIGLFKNHALLIGAFGRARSLSQERLDLQGVCAYGVHLSSDAKEFLIFGDKDEGQGTYCRTGTGAYSGNAYYDPDKDQVLDDFYLEPGFSLSPDGVDFVFIPPDINVTTTLVSGLPAEIKIFGPQGDFRSLTINEGGQITTQ